MALHGDDAYERKLCPLYDALDARSWKQAVKLADVALKKYKGDQLVRALKGFALHRCGKNKEALQLMHDIVDEGPEAERVLMTMAYTYKAAGQPGAITQAYIAAAEKHPRDSAILEGLFKSYVRDFNFVKQQQVAMKLSKLVPAGPDKQCSWWIVCSLALQARAALLHQDQQGNPLAAQAGSGLAADKLLQLAESMTARQVATAMQQQGQGKGGQPAVLLSYEALLLYLDILQGQGKAQQALEVLDGPMGGSVPLSTDRLQLRAAALVRAGDLPAAASCYWQAVQAAPDDWLSWQLYLDCMLPGSSSSGDLTNCGSSSRFPVGVIGGLANIWDRQQQAAVVASEDAAGALAAVENSMSRLSAEVAASDSWRPQLDKGALRGPHLWRCELLLRRQRLAQAAAGLADAVAETDEEQQQLVAAVGQAFAKLAANFSCVSDLRPYLATLSGAAGEELAAAVHRQAAELNAKDLQGTAADSSSSSSGVASGTFAANGSGSNSAGGSSNAVSGEIRRLQRLVNAHQIELELGLPRFAATDEAVAHAARLLDLYRRHMHLSAGFDEKERGYGEELVAASVESLVVAATLETAAAAAGSQAAGAAPLQRALTHILQAVLVLEAVQQRRKVSAPLRLAATALYSLLGAPKLAATQLAALDIKSILHDSMTGHWLLPLLVGSAAADADLRRWVDGCAMLHELHQADAGETLGTALEHGTYSKVLEFVDFKERLQHSHSRALAAVGCALLDSHSGNAGGQGESSGKIDGDGLGQRAALQQAWQLLAAAEPAAGEVATGGALICFNEDLSTRPSWYPPGPPSSSAVASWWQMAAQGKPHAGYAHCWWARPLVAEACSPAADSWRQRCLAELRTKVAWALITSSSLATAAAGAALLEQLQPLLQQPATIAESGASLQAAACGAALAVLQVLGGVGPAGMTAVQQLAHACSSAAEQVAADLAAVESLPVLPGSATSAAAAATADCRGIAAVCSRLQKLAAAGGQEAVATATGEAACAAAAAASTVAKAAASLLKAPEQRVEGALQMLEGCSGGGGSGDEVLWSFEPTLDVQLVVTALIDAQLAVLQNIQE